MSVLVVGDLNVDLEIRLPAGATTPEFANPPPRLTGGGSAANTAAALARLGVPCRFVGAVGDEAFGRFAVADLAAAGVDTTGVVITHEESTVVVVVVVLPGGERLIYVWPPSGGAHAALPVEVAVGAISDARWLHVSGISLRVTPARDAVLAAMAAARNSGVPVTLDLNLRLENWGWGDGFRDVAMAAVGYADFVVGSATDEICALAGSRDPEVAARMLVGGNRVVVARLGPGGAFAVSGADGLVRSPGFSVPVADTVGAGDAFNAGFIMARLEGASVEEALRWGNAVAALTIGAVGARSTPDRSQLLHLLDASSE